MLEKRFNGSFYVYELRIYFYKFDFWFGSIYILPKPKMKPKYLTQFDYVLKRKMF